jgi:hypothetical protein
VWPCSALLVSCCPPIVTSPSLSSSDTLETTPGEHLPSQPSSTCPTKPSPTPVPCRTVALQAHPPLAVANGLALSLSVTGSLRYDGRRCAVFSVRSAPCIEDFLVGCWPKEGSHFHCRISPSCDERSDERSGVRPDAPAPG